MKKLPDSKGRQGSDDSLESTAALLLRVRAGDDSAREKLAARYLPILRRLAHGRLPRRARGLVDTDDLVQNTLVRAFKHMERFEPRREGAFMAYLSQALTNQLRDEARRAARKPGHEALGKELSDGARSPMEETIGHEVVECYQGALEGLPESQRQAVVLRIELDLPYKQIAEAVGSPSANAVRMSVIRGLVQIADHLKIHRGRE